MPTYSVRTLVVHLSVLLGESIRNPVFLVFLLFSSSTWILPLNPQIFLETSIFFWSHWLRHSVECCDETFTCLATKHQQNFTYTVSTLCTQGCSLQPPKSPVIGRFSLWTLAWASIAAGVIESHFLAPLHIVSVLTLLSSTGQAFIFCLLLPFLSPVFPIITFSGLLTLSLTLSYSAADFCLFLILQVWTLNLLHTSYLYLCSEVAPSFLFFFSLPIAFRTLLNLWCLCFLIKCYFSTGLS